MAVSIPIISEFNKKGVSQALDSFRQLETTGQKVSFAVKKAAMGAGVALAGIGAAAVAVGGFLFNAAKAADADRKSQIDLARTAEKFAKANQKQIDSLEGTVEQLMLATGIADDDLRPALGRLLRSFKNTDKASRAMRISLDIAGRTGKDLDSIVEAMGKAADGSNTALLRLGTGLSRADLKGKSLEEIMSLLETRFKGGAADAADSFEGRLGRLRARFGEIVEEIGYKVLPYFERLADMAIQVADAFGRDGISGAWEELKRQFAQAGFESSPIGKFFRDFYNSVRFVYNGLVDLYNLAARMSGAKLLSDISGFFGGPTLPSPSKMPGWDAFSRSQVPQSTAAGARMFEMRGMAAPLTRTYPSSVVVNVTNNDPQAVVRALQTATRRNGSLAGIGIR
jgi:hypothetical protein